MKRELIIATCQFPVSGDIKRNASYILRQMAEAKEKGADILHFPESSLSGYAGTDFKRYKKRDEALRRASLEKIIQLSSELKIWAIIGSHHFSENNKLPYNCLWISASNTSARESCFASFVVRPDGKILHRLKRNVSGILISKIDYKSQYLDPSAPWRKRATRGILHSDRL